MALSLTALPSHATFPGKNGRIAYVSYGDFGNSYNKIFLTDSGQLTFGSSDEYDFFPAFSPDGSKLAFVRQTLNAGQYFYRVMVVNVQTRATSTVANSGNFPGIRMGFLHITTPAWSADGQRISFAVSGQTDDRNGIWTVGGSAGLVQTVQDASVQGLSLNRSPVTDEIAYACSFRIGGRYNQGLNDLCTFDERTGRTRHLPIDLALSIPSHVWGINDVKWMPDGEKIVFHAFYHTFEGAPEHSVDRHDIFSIDANGSGLRRITDSGADTCPQPFNNASVASYAFEWPTPSPDGTSLLLQRRRAELNPQPPCGYGGWGDAELVVLNMSGGATPLVLSPRRSALTMDWEPLPADLTVKIDDGHGHPLNELKVQVRNKDTNAIIYENPIHNGEGTYIFEDVPPDDYVVRATLIDFSDGPGSTPAFEIRHNFEPGEAAWAEHSVTVLPTGGTVAYQPFDIAGTLTRTSMGPENRGRLDDLGAIYYQLQRYVAWVKRTLTPVTGEKVELYAFADTDTTSGNTVPPDAAYYRSSGSEIVFGTEFSRYEYRDGTYSEWGDEAPENGEWHEFNHHLWGTFIKGGRPACAGSNHDGYKNPDTCDSMNEGLASFLAAAAARDLDGATDSFYDGIWDLEPPTKAWSSRTGRSGRRINAEDLAVPALLWDLLDANADRHDTQVIAQDGSHQAVTYTDQESHTVSELWTRFMNARPLTVYDLRVSFGIPDLTIDLDEDGSNDIAPIDQVFLMHGFFPIDHDQTLTGSHKSYHYDVDYAQRIVATAPRNSVVGVTSHRAFSADGTVTQEIIPRFHVPTDPGANVAINVQDASGTPLSGAEVDLVIYYPDQPPAISTRRLGSGNADLVYLELPSYFDYLLPEDAPLPECDPANDVQINVTVKAKVNGYESADQPSFDNCTYQRAVAASTGTAALTVTATFPEDSIPPVSTIDTISSGDLVGTATQGFWTVRLSCEDPPDSGFAAGCARLESRLDNGPVTEYQRSVRVTEVGQHTFEYRSVDAAGNEEAWRSVALDIVAGPPPVITSFSPTSGVTGTSVTITGTDLNDATGVTFNGVSASFTVGSPTQVNATVPAGAVTGPIGVTTQYGTATSTANFVVIPPPAITGFSPPFGNVGAVVNVTGANFAGATSLTFGGTAAGFVINSPSQLTTMVPAGANTGPIRVTTPGGTAASATNFVVTVGLPPDITSFSPTSGAAGTAVTIRGTSLTGASAVTFNGTAASFRLKGSSISATVPAGATTGPITVYAPGGWESSAASFVVPEPPSITGFSPTSGAPGSTVTVSGTNFTNASSVKMGGSSAKFTVVSATTITAIVPKGAKSGPISVTNAAGTATSAGSFTVVR